MRGNAVDEVLCHQAGCEDPAIGLHALRKFDLALTELDRKQRLYGAICFPGHRISLLMLWCDCSTKPELWHCGATLGRWHTGATHGYFVAARDAATNRDLARGADHAGIGFS